MHDLPVAAKPIEDEVNRQRRDDAYAFPTHGESIRQLKARMVTMSTYERWSKRAARVRTAIADDSFFNYDDRDNLLAEVDSLIEEAKSNWS